MVRATLDGRKTQTRRVVTKQPPASVTDIIDSGRDFVSAYPNRKATKPFEYSAHCPYGAPGDRLWVRETFHESNAGDVIYRADYPANAEARGLENIPAESAVQWRPSIFMPRTHSRLTLELTGVRVERVQAISRDDAIAEGVEAHDDDGVTYYGPFGKGHCDPAYAYARLWDSLNSKRGYSWNSNPWVWVLEFRRTDGA